MDAAEARSLIREARAVAAELKASPTPEEAADLLERAQTIEDQVRAASRDRDREALRDQLASMGTRTHIAGDPPISSVFTALETSQWEIGRKTAIAPEVAIGVKALIDDPGNASILRTPGILVEPADSRYVYPRLPIQNPGDATSVTALVSEGRTLAADVKPVASTDEKLVTDSAAVLVDYPMRRAATVSSYYPNSIVSLPAFRVLVDSDMTTAYRQELDAYVVDEIVTGAGVTDDDDATDGTLVGQIRVGQQVVQDAGMNPDLVILGSADALALDLLRGVTDGAYLLDPSPRAPGASPLFGMSVVVGVGVASPIVLDTSAVQVWVGAAEFAADTATQFSTNRSRFRLESPCLAVVRQPAGVYVVAPSS